MSEETADVGTRPSLHAPRTILITGATDGLGLAMARQYAGGKARLVLVGRQALADLDGPFFNASNYCQADLARPDAATRVEAFLQSQGIETLDLVIQNAGMGYIGPLAHQTAANIRDLVVVNLEAVAALTHLFLPRLRAAGGSVVFISSVTAALATPEYAVYSATKAALDGFARNLRIETGDSVRVQVIHPGAARTGMHRKAGGDPVRMKWERFPSAEAVAAQMIKAIERGQAHYTPGMINKVVRWAGLWLGGALDRAMMRRS